jgi:hypothetical protein
MEKSRIEFSLQLKAAGRADGARPFDLWQPLYQAKTADEIKSFIRYIEGVDPI